MAVNMERRNFVKGYSLAILDVFLDGLCGVPQDSRTIEDRYFESFENCYPLISEAGDMLIEEAEKQGIATEGKSKHDIARELFSGRDASMQHNFK